MPKELGGAGGTGTNPEQLFAAGYSACFASAVKAVSGKAGKNADGIEVTATVGIGKKDDGEGFALSVKLQVHLPNLSQEEAQQMMTEAHKICPYSNATRNNIPVELSVV
jgi:Ohr subfamily peroxiredoxin